LTPLAQVRLGRVDPEKQTAELLDAKGSAVGVVDGAVLEAQFAVIGGYVIVTTDEDPFEGSLHFTLVDNEFRKIDVVELGLPYHSGRFRLHRMGPDETLQFSFFGDEVWLLEVSPRARLVLRRPLGPARYSSGFWRRHRLILSRLPLVL
jgi:hypothetical protein